MENLRITQHGDSFHGQEYYYAIKWHFQHIFTGRTYY